MEGDHDQSPAGRQNLQRSLEPVLQAVELVVDVHSDGLEGPGRRVDVAWPGAPRYRGLYRLRQGHGGAEGAALDHESGDPRGPALLAEVSDQTGQLSLGEAVDHLAGGEWAAAVHAH